MTLFASRILSTLVEQYELSLSVLSMSFEDINQTAMTDLAASLQGELVSVYPACGYTPRTVSPGPCREPLGTARTRCSRGVLRVSTQGE